MTRVVMAKCSVRGDCETRYYRTDSIMEIPTDGTGASGAEPAPRDGRALSTTLRRKLEREALAEEVRELETQLEMLKLRVGLPTRQDENSLERMRHANMELEEDIHSNLHEITRLRSMLNCELHNTLVNPLRTFIHLPADTERRKAILEDMKGVKLRRAQEVALSRFHGLDPLEPYYSEERYTGKDGLRRCAVFKTEQFEGLRDARQLYDALLFYNANLEISVTEMLGQLTLREDAAEIDSTVWNHRIVTAGQLNTVEEINLVGFAHFDDSYIPHGGSQFGVIATDAVDIDDLYPYKPTERTRKDWQSVYTVSEHRRATADGLVVVLKTCLFMTQLPPEFPAPPGLLDKLTDNFTRWSALESKFLREFVASNTPTEGN